MVGALGYVEILLVLRCSFLGSEMIKEDHGSCSETVSQLSVGRSCYVMIPKACGLKSLHGTHL